MFLEKNYYRSEAFDTKGIFKLNEPLSPSAFAGCRIEANVNWIGEGAESDTEPRGRGVSFRDNYHIFWYSKTFVDCQTRCKTVKKKKYFKFMAQKPNTGGVYDTYLHFHWNYGSMQYCWCYNKVDLSSTNQMHGTTSGEAQCAGETGGMP